MTIRLTPIVALTMALGLAACQEEDNTVVTETETTETTESTGTEGVETEESGVVPGDTNDAGSVTIIEPEDDASAGLAGEEDSTVESEATEMEEANQEATGGAAGGDQTEQPAATPAEDAAVGGAEGEGAAEIEADEAD